MLSIRWLILYAYTNIHIYYVISLMLPMNYLNTWGDAHLSYDSNNENTYFESFELNTKNNDLKLKLMSSWEKSSYIKENPLRINSKIIFTKKNNLENLRPCLLIVFKNSFKKQFLKIVLLCFIKYKFVWESEIFLIF